MQLGRLRPILLGSKLRVAATGLALLVALGVAGVATGVLGAPSVVGVDNRFGDVNQTTTTVESDLRIRNPNPVGVQLGGMTVDYAVEMNGLTMATGSRNGVAVPAGNSTLNFTSHIRNERIPDWWVSHLRNGERTTLAVDATVHSSLVGAAVGAPPVEREIATDVAASFDSTETRPVNASAPLVEDPVLYVNETSGRWGEVTDAETPILLNLTVYNPNDYPVSASSIGYDVTMNDVGVGNGSTERSITIPPGETREVRATAVIRNEALDEWWVTHLERDQVTDLSIRFYARIDLSALGGGSVRVPLDSVNHTVETDVFGTKNETGSGSGASTDGADGDDGESSTDDPSTASDGAATETAAGTPTTVTSDGGDGGLLGGDETESATDSPAGETPTATAAPTATATRGGDGETTTDDGGLL